jgi:hypothetical protein
MTGAARIRIALAGLVALFAPRVALACPICFGQNDSAMAIAINNGVLMMLGVVVVVLGCFALFIGYLVRQARRAASQADATGYTETHPQEGTV